MSNIQFLEVLSMRNFNVLLGALLQIHTWVLLLLLPLASEATANNNKYKVFKTPADSSVSFQIVQDNATHVICLGARTSHVELFTSISCLKRLKIHEDSGDEIHVLSKRGEDYGGIRFVSEEVITGSEAGKLTTVLLSSAGRPNNRWPRIDKEDYVSDIPISVQSYSPYTGNDERKQHRANDWLLSGCQNEQCALQNDDNLNLSDGEAIFRNEKLLCVNASGHCNMARSVKRINDGSCKLKCFQCLVTDSDVCIEGSGSGTCINQKTQQICDYGAFRRKKGDIDCPWGYCSVISCPAGYNPPDSPDTCECKAFFGFRDHSLHQKNCTSLHPDNCIDTTGNCPQCHDEDDNDHLMGILVGSLAVLCVVIPTTYCLYKNRHHFGYKKLGN
ncbi:hypothetical protein [Endozoicomonas sp. SESOKO4]|uniref:hypothetical protein n=1 Tax=Endozoicomonas sp. SESOKO4 TaxID=2828745 RepID=UPI0021472CF0|nr:hypothetical protein [Endozoicomonas sp. SESOKO4]